MRLLAELLQEQGIHGAGQADVQCGTWPWQVYDWRRKLGAGKTAVPASAINEAPFAALVVEAAPPATSAPGHKSAGMRAA